MKKVTLSVGFADLTHWSRAADALGSEGAVQLLDEAYREAGDAIVSNGGTIHKYIGDAVMFSFASPEPAMKAAHEMARFRRDVHGLDVAYHVAVATGEVLLVEIGHPSHRVQDLIGTTVNRAGKLLRQAHGDPSHCAFCDVTLGGSGGPSTAP